MSEPPDKTRVIRLVKKPPQAPKAPANPPPSEPPKPATGQPKRFDRPRQSEGERRFDRPRRPEGERRFDRPRQSEGERRFDRPRQPEGERRFDQPRRPPWKKKPFQKQPGLRKPRAPRPPKPAPVVLTEEQRLKILDLYRGMVMAGERPAEGRRKRIAEMLGVPYANVADVVRSYVTHERYRRTNFDIEKAYWQAVREGEANARTMAKQIADRLNLEEGRVWWWLEKLHEPRRSFANDPEVEAQRRAEILALYENYLQQPEPPEKGLHQWLAEQVEGVSPRQIHKVLWEYRMNIWKSLEGTTAEPATSAEPNQQTE